LGKKIKNKSSGISLTGEQKNVHIEVSKVFNSLKLNDFKDEDRMLILMLIRNMQELNQLLMSGIIDERREVKRLRKLLDKQTENRK